MAILKLYLEETVEGEGCLLTFCGVSHVSVGGFFWFRFARGSGLFFGAGLAFALAALTLAGLRIDLFGGIRPAPFTSFQGFSRLWREEVLTTSWRDWERGGGKTLSGGLGASWPTSSPDAFFVRGSWWGEGGPEKARLLLLEAWCFAHQRGRLCLCCFSSALVCLFCLFPSLLSRFRA